MIICFVVILVTIVDVIRQRPPKFGVYIVIALLFFSFRINEISLSIPIGAISYWCARKKILEDKEAKTDIGGVDFVYSEIRENFLQNAQNTYYKYVENNIYNNRKQSLPVVSNITIDSVENDEYEYNEKSDSEAYKIKVSWTYTDDKYSDYQKEAELIFIHDDIKLSLVELQ